MRKSLGDKRREIPPSSAQEIVAALGTAFEDGEHSKVFPTTHFGYRKITVERPLRLNFQASPERIARLEDEKGFPHLAQSARRRTPASGQGGGRGPSAAGSHPARCWARCRTTLYQRPERIRAGSRQRRAAGRPCSCLRRSARRSSSALSERDETAEICRDKDGNPEPDPELRDTENVPLAERRRRLLRARGASRTCPTPGSTRASATPRTARSGKVGYEINFNRYFYQYTPPRPLEEIEADIRGLETEIMQMLGEVTGSR